MKMKFEFKHFDTYVTTNLLNLIRVSKRQDSNTFQLANSVLEKINDIQSRMESKSSRFQFIFQIQESLNKFIYNQAFKKSWLDFQEIVNKQLFYWAKTGDFEKFA